MGWTWAQGLFLFCRERKGRIALNIPFRKRVEKDLPLPYASGTEVDLGCPRPSFFWGGW